MSRISTIVTNVRDILGDPNALRYSDDFLMRSLNTGLTRINLEAKLLKARTYIKLEINTSYYDISSIALDIDRVEYLEEAITSKTSVEMDMLDPEWRSKTGDKVKFVVFDTTKSGTFYTYPLLTENVLNNVTVNQIYGGIIDITVSDTLFQQPVDDIESYTYKYLAIYYTKKPDLVTISTTDENLEFDSLLDDALIYFISGTLLRVDSDTRNRQFGTEQYRLFSSYVDELRKKQGMSNNSVIYQEIPYRGFI